MTFQEIAAAVGGVRRDPPDGAAIVSRVCADVREVEPGCLFVPWGREGADERFAVGAALEAGAAGCLCAGLPETPREDKIYIQVADVRAALRDLASACRGDFRIPAIQITGSVGKTTTKEMLSAVLSERLQVLETPGELNGELAAALTLLRLEPQHQAAVMETGMDRSGQIRRMGEMIRPDIAVISNIGDAHMETLGSREDILRAKSEILENLAEGGLAILNGDDALLDTIQAPARILRCGQSKHCGVRITEIADHGVEGLTCTVATQRDIYRLSVPVPGEHMAYPASMAVAVGEELGLSREEIIRGAAACWPSCARRRVLRLRGGRLILDDCGNTVPHSAAAALEVLAKTACGFRTAVLGDMGGPDGAAGQAYYNMGALAAMLGIDLVAAVGERAAPAADGAAQGGALALRFSSGEEAAAGLGARLEPNSAVLVKASSAAGLDKLVELLKRMYD